MSENNTYNGWTNYQTWVCSIWMDNDRGSYEHYSETARDLLKLHKDKTQAEDELSKIMKDDLDGEMQCMSVEGLFGDLLQNAVDQIDFNEIAKSMIEDIYEEIEETEN